MQHFVRFRRLREKKRSSRGVTVRFLVLLLLASIASNLFDVTPVHAEATFTRGGSTSGSAWNNSATASTTGTKTLTVTLTSHKGTGTGRLLIAGLSLKTKPTSNPTISGWTLQKSLCSGSVACSYIFTKMSDGTETSVVATIVVGTTPYSAIMTVLEYSGAVNTNVNSVTLTGSTTASIASAALTAQRSGSLLFAIFAQERGTSYTSISPGWTERYTDKNTGANGLNIGYFDQTSSVTAGTSYTATPTISGQDANWSSILFNFDSAQSAQSDIAVTNSASSAAPSVGDTVTYTVTATNNGSSDNTGVQITALLPSGLTYVSSSPDAGTTYTSSTGVWNIGAITNGSTKTLTITATVNSNQGGNTITTTASKTASDITDPTSGNNSASAAVNVKSVTATPVVTSPIYTAATTISGTSTEANGTTITVLLNGTSTGTTTVTGNAWTKSVSALGSGALVTATALASAKSISATSSSVTVTTPKSATPTVDSPVLPNATTITGTSSEANGTTITVYSDGSSLGTTTVSSGTWSKSVSARTANQVITARATATNKFISDASASVTVQMQSAAPVITSTTLAAGDTSVSGTSTEADGTTITVYVDGSSVGTTTVSSSAWTKSSLTALTGGQAVTTKATASSKAISNASNSVTVLYVSAAPVVTSPILVGATTISGTSSEADGTAITVYIDGTATGSTVSVTSGAWSKTVTGLGLSRVITAKATASGKAISTASNSVTVQAQSAAPVVTSPISAGATSVSGTSSEANGTTMTVYVDGSSVGTTTVSSNAWTKSSLTALTVGQVVTAKATASGKTMSAASSSVTVQSASAIPVVTSPIIAGSTSISGTSTEATGALIEVYCVRGSSNCSSASRIGSTTVSLSAWTLSLTGSTFTASTLQTSDVVTAKATGSGKIVSAASSSVTVTDATSPIPTLTSPIVAGDTSISGRSSGANGTTIEVFKARSTTTNSLGTTTVTSGAWTLSGLASSALKAGDTITAKARIDTNNDGSNNSSDNYSTASSSITVIVPVSPVPTVSAPIIGGAASISGTSTGSDGTPGTLIQVFKARSGVTTSLGTTTVTSNAWTLSGLSSSTLQTGDIITAQARIDTNGNGVNNNGDNYSALSSGITVTTATSPVPTVNVGILAGNTSISGTSSGPSGTPGTLIQVFKARSGVTTSLGTTTVTSNAWTLSGLSSSTLQTGDIITAQARIDTNSDGVNNASDTYSSFTSGITVANRVSQAPAVNELTAGATSVSGTSTGANGTLIKVYVNSNLVGSTTVSSGVWTLSSITALVMNDLVTATATVDTNNDGTIDGSDPASAPSSAVIVAGLPVTAAPAINAPIIAKDTSITGTSTEADGTSITVYVNGVSVGTTTVSSHSWTKAVSSSELQSGETVTAKATASGKTVSAASTSIVAIALHSPTPAVSQPVAGNTSVSGTSSGPDGTVIEVFRTRSATTVSLGTGSVTGGAWTLSGLASSTLQTNDVITAKARIDTNNDGSNNSSDVYSSSSSSMTVSGIVSAAPAVTQAPEGATSISGTSTGGNGTIIKAYVNGSLVGTGSVTSNAWTVSPVTALVANDQLTATATFDTNNDGVVNGSDTVSALSSVITVAGSSVTAAPAVNQPLVAKDTTIAGTSSEANGATIKVYVNSVLLSTSTITVASGAWSVTVTGSTLQADEIVTATATASAKSTSAPSTEIVVLALTSPVPTVNAVTAAATSISGTSSATGDTVINVIRQRGSGTGSLGTTTVSSTGAWVLSGLSSSALHGADVITAKARIDTNNDAVNDGSDTYSAASSNVTVSSLTSAAPTVSALTEGATSISGTSTGRNGTLIKAYVNDSLVGTGSVTSNAWTVSPVTALVTNNLVKATATFDTNNDGTVDGSDDASAYSTTVTVGGLPVSAAPAVNAPIIARDTTISGTSSEASGTTITVSVGGVSVGTTTVSGGAWSRTVSTSELQSGEVVTAKATASGKSISSESTGITVQARTSPAPTVTAVTAASTSISGTSSGTGGTVIEVFRRRGSGTGSLGTTTVSGGAWTLSGLASSALQANDVITAKARIDTNNDGSNNGSDVYSASSSDSTVLARSSPTPTVSTPTVGDTVISGTSTAADGAVIRVYINGSLLSANPITVTSSAWSVSISASALHANDIITAKARIDTNNDDSNNNSDVFSSASSDATVLSPSSKSITAFSFSEGVGTISGTGITVTVPNGTSLTSLTPTITISGISVSPTSGIAQNFTSPVQYTVTAEDSSTLTYQVTVSVAAQSNPTVVSITPSNGSTNIELSTQVVVRFSTAMNPDSYTISDNGSNSYTQTTWSSGSTIATSTHAPWRKGRSITVTIDGNNTDGLSVSGSSSYSWSFTTTSTPIFQRNTPLRSTTSLDVSGVVSAKSGSTISVNDVTQSITAVTSGNLSAIDFSLTGRVSDQTIVATHAATLTSTGTMTIRNATDLPTVSVAIPNNTTVYSGDCWDSKIILTTGAKTGTPPSGYSIGDTVLEVGSTCGILLLDQPVTISLTGVNGAIGYKVSGSAIWTQISTCGGTYDSPTLAAPTSTSSFGECSISNGTDTKVLTYHLTTFGQLVAQSSSSSSSSTKNTGGTSGGGGTRGSLKQSAMNDAFLQRSGNNSDIHGAAPSPSLLSIIERCSELSLPYKPESKRGRLVVQGKEGTTLFWDVLLDSMFTPYIGDLASKGIISGYKNAAGKPTGEYAPDKSVSIAEVLKMAMEAFQDVPTSSILPKNRSAKTSWAAPYVARAEELQLPFFKRRVNINAPATRAQAIEIFAEVIDVNIPNDSSNLYRDVPLSMPYAFAINQATRLCWIEGYRNRNNELTGIFRPSDTMNRDEAAKILSVILARKNQR